MTASKPRPSLAFPLALLLVPITPAPAPAQVFSRVGQGGGQSTSVGQNRQRNDPLAATTQQLQALIQLQKQVASQAPAPASVSATASSSGGPQYPWVDGYEPPPQPTWRQRVETARASLVIDDRPALARALASEDAAVQFAVLSLEAEGKIRFKESVLTELLERSRDRAVARAAVVLLGKRRSASAYLALEGHVAARGLADDSAVKVLWAAGPPRGKDVFFQRASQASGRDDTSLLAIRALALIEGEAVTQLLERLSTDWAKKVREAAEQAMAMRAQAGLPTRTAIKPLPYGEPMEKLLQEAPEVADWNAVYRDQLFVPPGEGKEKGEEKGEGRVRAPPAP